MIETSEQTAATALRDAALTYLAATKLLYRETVLREQAARYDLHAAKQHCRPCMMLDVELSRTHAGWTASYGGVYVVGDTPDVTFAAFDRAWVGADEGQSNAPRFMREALTWMRRTIQPESRPETD